MESIVSLLSNSHNICNLELQQGGDMNNSAAHNRSQNNDMNANV